MSSRFKPNNFFAILIAIILVLIGFTLAFINKQTETAREQTNVSHTIPASDATTDEQRKEPPGDTHPRSPVTSFS